MRCCNPFEKFQLFKEIKRDSLDNIKIYKARLVAKGFTPKEGIDYNETFSPVSKKDYLRIILALVAHFDLKLQQMDVKTTFLTGDLEDEVNDGCIYDILNMFLTWKHET